jgi:hypothetical protein
MVKIILKKSPLILNISFADGTSPTPMLFASINNQKNDISSRHQQIIDAFLDDGKNSINRN